MVFLSQAEKRLRLETKISRLNIPFVIKSIRWQSYLAGWILIDPQIDQAIIIQA